MNNLSLYEKVKNYFLLSVPKKKYKKLKLMIYFMNRIIHTPYLVV